MQSSNTIFSVLVLCTQVNMMFLMSEEHVPTVARHILQACPVWIYTQNNITDICIFNLCRTNIDIIIITFNIIIIIIFIEETFSYCMFFKKDLKCRLNVKHSSLIYWDREKQFVLWIRDRHWCPRRSQGQQRRWRSSGVTQPLGALRQSATFGPLCST